MKQSKSIFLSIVLFFTLSIFTTTQLSAQRKYDDKEYEPPKSLRERLFIGSYLNSPYFAGDSFGTQFGVGLQPFVGYRLNEFIATGFTVKFDYTYFWNQSQSVSLTDFASTVFLRGTLAQKIILQLEGGYYSNQSLFNTTEKIRNNFPVAYAGVGYTTGGYEILLSYELTGNLMQYRIPFEYKIGIIFDL